MNQLAQEFRDLRLKMDLGIKQAAKMIKRGQSTVQRLELGHSVRPSTRVQAEQWIKKNKSEYN